MTKIPVLLFTVCMCLNAHSQVPTQNKQLVLKSGLEKYEKGDFQGAITQFDNALKLDPTFYELCVVETFSIPI